MLTKIVALGVLGFAGYKYLAKDRMKPAFAANQGDVQIRESGPKAMRDEPGGPWSKTDEEVDESFPASDPPANY